MATRTTITDKQLVTMAKLLGYDASIASGSSSWGLQALTVAHGMPSTHAQASENANRLGRLLTGSKTLTLGPAPKLHYSNAKGGVASAFKGSYNPRRFGVRTRKGSDWALRCNEHKSSFDKCNDKCEVGVTFNDRYLIDTIRKGKANKADKVAVPTKQSKVAPARKAKQPRKASKATQSVTVAKATVTPTPSTSTPITKPSANLAAQARADAFNDMRASGFITN